MNGSVLTFTGAHLPAKQPEEKIPDGLIMSSTNKTYADKNEVRNAKLDLEICTKAKDKRVIGISYTTTDGEFQISSVGEGTMLFIRKKGDTTLYKMVTISAVVV